ncbi:putative cytochrome b-c1 complex subunit 10 protein [Neofusicoccum parvum UCRNP2]|uniref:Putative cytochrome b-c1 complex subunit 10 protein n=1 Tax=Botryosphaeria parva (strain UCR-NP2) TaxID=1287680 RepID=R1E6G8_BOTPV|nr:putative cytochrome b-c1 complex subunit 10 protein [Neofusicoccum parvum UCRNP2]
MSTRPDLQHTGARGMQPWAVRPGYSTYKSPFGPKPASADDMFPPASSGTTAAGFGVAAGVFALFFFAEVPRVREDVTKKIPGLHDYFDVKIAPEDNPF